MHTRLITILVITIVTLLLQACGPSDNEVAIAQAKRDEVVAGARSVAAVAQADASQQVAKYEKEGREAEAFWGNVAWVIGIGSLGIVAIIVAFYVGRMAITWLKHRVRVDEYQIMGYLPPPPSRPYIPQAPTRRALPEPWEMPAQLIDSQAAPAPRRRYTNEELKQLEDRRLALYNGDRQ
jgi:hypothetical protein